MINLGVFGCGGFGREVMPLVVEQYGLSKNGKSGPVFVVDMGTPCPDGYCNHSRVITTERFLQIPMANYVIAVGDPAARRSIDERLKVNGARPFRVISKRAHMMPPHSLDEGSIICAFASIHPNAIIGRHFHANIYSYVAHDCEVGDYVTLAPGAMVNGHCKIGDGAYIGTGAMLREKVSIGAGAVVGMGAVVVKDVPPGVTVVGNPAKPLMKYPSPMEAPKVTARKYTPSIRPTDGGKFRLIELKDGERWVACEFENLRPGDVFRVMNNDARVWIVKTTPQPCPPHGNFFMEVELFVERKNNIGGDR